MWWREKVLDPVGKTKDSSFLKKIKINWRGGSLQHDDQWCMQSVSCLITKGASLSGLTMIDDHKGHLIDQLMSCQMVAWWCIRLQHSASCFIIYWLEGVSILCRAHVYNSKPFLKQLLLSAEKDKSENSNRKHVMPYKWKMANECLSVSRNQMFGCVMEWVVGTIHGMECLAVSWKGMLGCVKERNVWRSHRMEWWALSKWHVGMYQRIEFSEVSWNGIFENVI